MSFKDFLKQQQSGLEAMANTGVIGLHLVSGPAVGFAIGYGIDYWLHTSPWGKLIFLFIGIAAGFRAALVSKSRISQTAHQRANRAGNRPDTGDKIGRAANRAAPPLAGFDAVEQVVRRAGVTGVGRQAGSARCSTTSPA